MKIKYLKEQYACPGQAILMCEYCKGEYSARLGDYSLPLEHDLTCCGETLVLVSKQVIYQAIGFCDLPKKLPECKNLSLRK